MAEGKKKKELSFLGREAHDSKKKVGEKR